MILLSLFHLHTVFMVKTILSLPTVKETHIPGPTLVFRRYYQEKHASRQFYACAVHRNRKGCQFFHYTDQPLSEEKREHYMSLYREHQASLTQSHTVSLSSSASGAAPPINPISFCIECSLLYVTDKDGHIHSQHLHRERITKEEAQQPTLLLYPASDNKGQAVYKIIIVFKLYCKFFSNISFRTKPTHSFYLR